MLAVQTGNPDKMKTGKYILCVAIGLGILGSALFYNRKKTEPEKLVANQVIKADSLEELKNSGGCTTRQIYSHGPLNPKDVEELLLKIDPNSYTESDIQVINDYRQGKISQGEKEFAGVLLSRDPNNLSDKEIVLTRRAIYEIIIQSGGR